MPNKIIVLITSILFLTTTQTATAQTNEKWLPSSMEIYNDLTKDSVLFKIDYDSSNRMIGYLLSIEQNMESKVLTTYIKYTISYGSDNRPTELIKQNFNDEVAEKPKRYTVNYPEDNKVEIKSDTNYLATLYLDSNNNLPIRSESSNNDSLFRSQTNITYEYKNESLYKRIEEGSFVTKIGDRYIDKDLDPDPILVTSIFDYEADKKSTLAHFHPKWLSIYLRLDDIFTIPITVYSDDDKEYRLNDTDINKEVYYNDNGYKTGWETFDENLGEKVRCTIKYIKAK